MRLRLILILLCCCITGCFSEVKPEKPEDLLSKEQMVDILYDVFILNAAKGANKSKLEDNGIFPQDYVFEKHNIDSLQFANSNAYYGYFVEEYEGILMKVEERINANKARYQKRLDDEEKQKERKRDSIKKLSDSVSNAAKNRKKEEKRVDYKNYPNSSK